MNVLLVSMLILVSDPDAIEAWGLTLMLPVEKVDQRRDGSLPNVNDFDIAHDLWYPEMPDGLRAGGPLGAMLSGDNGQGFAFRNGPSPYLPVEECDRLSIADLGLHNGGLLRWGGCWYRVRGSSKGASMTYDDVPFDGPWHVEHYVVSVPVGLPKAKATIGRQVGRQVGSDPHDFEWTTIRASFFDAGGSDEEVVSTDAVGTETLAGDRVLQIVCERSESENGPVTGRGVWWLPVDATGDGTTEQDGVLSVFRGAESARLVRREGRTYLDITYPRPPELRPPRTLAPAPDPSKGPADP